MGSLEHDEPHEIVNDAHRENLLADIVWRFGAKNFHFHSGFEVVDVRLAYSLNFGRVFSLTSAPDCR